MDEISDEQQAFCRRHEAVFDPPAPGSRVGIALQTLDRQPLNGLRIAPHGAVCGWYLWGGEEPSQDPDFYQPLCVEHLPERCPKAVAFLGLPPGWRFLTDGTVVDVWFDASLVEQTEPAATADTGPPQLSSSPPRRSRLGLTVGLVLVVALGLASRRYPGRLFPEVLEKYPGDALWATMAFLGFAWLTPHAPTRRLAGLALGLSSLVEFSQLYRAPWLNAIRSTTMGHLVLGSAFSWVDLVAYAVGVAVGAGLDRAWFRRWPPGPAG